MGLVAHEHEHTAAAMAKASDDRRRYTQFNHDIHCALVRPVLRHV